MVAGHHKYEGNKILSLTSVRLLSWLNCWLHVLSSICIINSFLLTHTMLILQTYYSTYNQHSHINCIRNCTFTSIWLPNKGIGRWSRTVHPLRTNQKLQLPIFQIWLDPQLLISIGQTLHQTNRHLKTFVKRWRIVKLVLFCWNWISSSVPVVLVGLNLERSTLKLLKTKEPTFQLCFQFSLC